MGFMFKVKIDGIDCTIGFQKIGGLSRESAVVDYFENMYQQYHSLGKNGVMDDIHEKFKALPLEPLDKEE